jgi:uncharacterized protein (UPF0303 family)
MVFDDLDVAKQFYVEYAFKLGFGIRIGNTKYSQARSAVIDTVLSRVFECVHAGKSADEAKALRSKKGFMTATFKIIITILAMGSSVSDGAAKIFF